MNRRSFLRGLGAVIGGIALEQAVPFGRVYSFPTKIHCVNAFDEASGITGKYIVPVLFDNVFKPSPLFITLKARPLGEYIPGGWNGLWSGRLVNAE